MNKTVLLGLAILAPGLALADSDQHFVYTLTNQVGGNAIQTFQRRADGHLIDAGQVPTGGLGTGHGLGSQSALSLSEDGHLLAAVNAGDNTVSFLVRDHNGLTLKDTEPSGGLTPVSVTQQDGIIYVLNQGNATTVGNIQGFYWLHNHAVPIPGATWNLSAPGVVAVEIKFTPDRRGLIVAEKVSNLIDTFRLDRRAVPVSASYQPSVGPTPFGFDFDNHGRFYITEAAGGAANASTVSSYWLDRDLTIHAISESVPTFQTAACWDVVSPNGQYVYTGNTGSGNVTGYKIHPNGSITRLTANGVSGVTGGSAIDTAMTGDSHFLYVLSGGNLQITGFRVDNVGNLHNVDAATGLSVGTSGLVAR